MMRKWLVAVVLLSCLPASVFAAGGSGRVVEYSNTERKATSAGTETRPRARGSKDKTEAEAVQLITGGDSEEGSAKVGRLPVLD